MERITTLLKSFGLSSDEAAVYLAALELGEATMQTLSRKSKVNRSTIYTFIDKLKNRGFVVESKKGKRRMYGATHPERLLQMQKIRTAELANLLPELLAVNNKSRNKPRVAFYEGVEGIKDIHADMLTASGGIVAYEDLEGLEKNLPADFFDYFPKERSRRKIPYRSISRDSKIAREFLAQSNKLIRETKLIDVEPLNIEMSIYDDKVALMSMVSSPPFGVLIQDRNIAEVHKAIWAELWKRI